RGRCRGCVRSRVRLRPAPRLGRDRLRARRQRDRRGCAGRDGRLGDPSASRRRARRSRTTVSAVRRPAVELPPVVSALALGLAALTLAGCGGGTNDAGPAADTEATRHSDHSYNGVGSQIIGTLSFPVGADAKWTCTGGLFMLIAVNAPASAQLIVSKEA